MNKWTEAAKKIKEQMDAVDEKVKDMQEFFDALPSSQRKVLFKNEKCGKILQKYGIKEE